MLDAKQQAVQNLYNSLLRTLDDNKKIKLINNSIYLTLINKNLNDVIKFLIESGISKNSIDTPTLNYLLEEYFIFEFNDLKDSQLEMIALNAHGIFYWEKKNDIIDINNVISILNDKWKNKLPKSENKDLTIKERLVLLVLLCMRCFNINHCLNATKYDEDNYRPWLRIFRDCDEFIQDNNLGDHYDSLDNELIGNQDTVFAIVSRIEHLQSKTNMILDNGKTKKKCYFLDVSDNEDNINIKRLSKIMSLICEKNSSSYTPLLTFIKQYYNDNWSKVYDKPNFMDFSTDEKIEEAVYQALKS